MERLAAFVAGPEADGFPLNPTRLNDPLPALEDAAHKIVARATAAEDRFWLVLDDCDRLDPHADAWDAIGVLARAIYEHTPVRSETVPRLVLLGYAETMRQLPYEIRKNECRDTARPADADDLRRFFEEFFTDATDTTAPGWEESVRELTETAVSEVLRAVDSPPNGESHMRRLCTAVEDVVRLHRALPRTSAPPGEAAPLLRDTLRATLSAPAAALPDPRRSYREAACLLQEFDPALLRLPGEELSTGRAVLELVDDCTALPSPGATVWTLKPEVRDATLAGLAGPGAALRALRVNIGLRPQGSGPEHTALALLSGTGPPLAPAPAPSPAGRRRRATRSRSCPTPCRPCSG